MLPGFWKVTGPESIYSKIKITDPWPNLGRESCDVSPYRVKEITNLLKYL